MESLYITGQGGTFPTPFVSFEADGVLSLSGESHPENAAAFYAPLILWLDALIDGPPRPLVFEVRLTFFSAHTRPQLIAMLRRLRRWANRGAEVEIHWYIDIGDDDMIDTAADFGAMSGLPLRIVRTHLHRHAVGSSL